MFNVTVIMLFFFLIFGILFVSYFKGKFYTCTNTHFPATDFSSLAHKWDCLNQGAEWLNHADTFDDIFAAMRSLFIMATAAAWADMMYMLASATEIDYVLVPMNNTFWIYFCIFFIIVSSFFFINLFVGVVISTFNSE